VRAAYLGAADDPEVEDAEAEPGAAESANPDEAESELAVAARG
jgi:hypothetical protein